MSAIGRNEPCPCGSGLKYKRCCALKQHKTPLGSRIAISLIGLMLLTGAIFMLMSLDDSGTSLGRCPAGQVWSVEHQHCH
jgi:hypothetical protein